MKISQIAFKRVSHGCEVVEQGYMVVLTGVDAVDRRECDEQGKIGASIVDPVQTEAHGGRNRHGVLAAVHKVRKDVPGIVITSETLKGTPNSRQSREEAKQSRMTRVALLWICPVRRIQTEE